MMPARGVVVFAFVVGLGCSPSVHRGDDTGNDVAACGYQVGDSPALRRLTQTEINNSLRDLLGDMTNPASQFAPDPEVAGFRNNSGALNVTGLLATQLFSAADDLSHRAVDERLDQLLPCDKVDGIGCAQQFIDAFGKRTYRRPLEQAEKDSLLALYQTGASFKDGVRLVIQRLLVSPYFLYRMELGDTTAPPVGPNHAVPLTQYELASRLSFFITQSPPDDELIGEADLGQLDTPERIARQARRLLADWRARGAITEFHDQWLGFSSILSASKDEQLFPAFTDEVRLEMRQEALAFIEHLFWEGGDARNLFTSTETYLNDQLATYYGATREAGFGYTKSPLPAGQQRAGLLSLGALTATYSYPTQISPVHRGKFVRNRLLCQELAPPPPNVNNKPPEPSQATTLRERWAKHSEDASCAGCHRLTDPIGFGTSNIDAAGRWQEMDNGVPIDASGEIVGFTDGKFNGIAELGQKLAASNEALQCIVTQWFRFALGRMELTFDQCTIDQLTRQFRDANYDMRELIVAMVQTNAFRYRQAVTPAPDNGEFN